MTTISNVELDLATERLDADGMLTDVSALSLSQPGPREALVRALERRRGRPLRPPTLVVTAGHGRVWVLFDPPTADWEAEVAAVRRSIRRDGRAAVWPPGHPPGRPAARP